MNVVEFQRLYGLAKSTQGWLLMNCHDAKYPALAEVQADSVMRGIHTQLVAELGKEWFISTASKGRYGLPWTVDQATKFYTDWMQSPNVRLVSGSVGQQILPWAGWFDPAYKNYYYQIMQSMDVMARAVPLSARLTEFILGDSFVDDDVRNFLAAWAAWKDKPTQISHKGGITGLLDDLFGGSGLMEKYGGVLTWVGVGIGVLIVMSMFNRGGAGEERR